MFKKGDLITGKTACPYRYTTKDALMLVVGVYEERLEVEILEHSTMPYQVGSIWPVDSSYFKLWRPS